MSVQQWFKKKNAGEMLEDVEADSVPAPSVTTTWNHQHIRNDSYASTDVDGNLLPHSTVWWPAAPLSVPLRMLKKLSHT